MRYGGNTTCIEIRTDNNELIIIDAGTGIFPLSQSLLKELPITANVLISHSHSDHIQGLPFFQPNFIPGNILRLQDGQSLAHLDRAGVVAGDEVGVRQ